MKAICDREGLLTACQLASAALPARDVKPILRNFKAIAGDGRCTIMATDLELGIRLDVQGLMNLDGIRNFSAGKACTRNPSQAETGTPKSCFVLLQLYH